MRKITTTQSAFFYLRASIGLLLISAGAFLALSGIGQYKAEAQQRNTASSQRTQSVFDALVPPMFDCSQSVALGLDKQENLRAGAIAIYCGISKGGTATASDGSFSIAQEVIAPLLGTTDVDVIQPGTESGTHITQSETFVSANTDNPNEIVVAYNDSRNATASIFSGASVSTDGGNTFARLTKANGQSPFTNTFGDPVVLYQSTSATWFTVWLDGGCGGQGLGGYKSTTPSDPNSWTHFCVHNNSADDRNSGVADNNPSSPFNGRMYISWNDFNRGGGALFVRFSDNGTTWTEKQITTGFIRDVQITVDQVTGTVFLAGMDEQGGGLTNRVNKMYRSTDGGNTWTNTYTGPAFPGPGRTTCPNPYFACMFSTGGAYWRHMGWGQPAARNGVVHYVYDSRNTGNGDPANAFYIRSTDNGVTFSAPFQLNGDATTKGNWQPNLTVADDNSLVAVWYDERSATAACAKGNTAVPCYQMWSRKSTDGGATWQAESTFSDVVTALPGQPDAFIIGEYAGDYDYAHTVGSQHLHPWTDGRVAVSGAAQQNVFIDRDGGGGGGGIPCDDLDSFQTRCIVQGGRNKLQARLTLTDSSHNGEQVTITVDGQDFDVVIQGNRAQVVRNNAASGSHTIELTDPAGCFPPSEPTCQ